MSRILTSEHVTVAGMTGTGKSHLAAIYLAGYNRVVKHDTKGEAPFLLSQGINPWPQVHPKELTIVTKLEDLIDMDSRTPYIIYSPVHEELNPDTYQHFYDWCYYQRGQTVWVDEVMEVLESPHKIIPAYKGILTRGRFFDVSMWQCTQRPQGIPALCIGMSTHIFAFNLQLDQDREKITKLTGVPDFLNKPDGHDFQYWRSGWQSAKLGRMGRG